MVLDVEKITIAVPFSEVRPLFRKNMRVDIDCSHALHRLGCLHYSSTFCARSILFTLVKPVHDRRKLFHNVCQMEILAVNFVTALFAEPDTPVRILFIANFFDDETHRVCRSLRRMRDFGWQQEYFAFTDRDVFHLPVLYDAERDVSLDLVKKLLALVIVEVFSGIGATDHHNDEISCLIVDTAVTYGWFQKVPVFTDPVLEIDGWEHGVSSLKWICVRILQQALIGLSDARNHVI